MSDAFARLDNLTVDDLGRQGGLKWGRTPGTIGAWIAESDLGTAPAVRLALQSALDRGMLAYPPADLSPALGEATTSFLNTRFGWDVDPESIAALPDALKALEVAIQLFTEDDSPVIVPTPAYMPFLYVPQMLGRTVIEVPSIRTPEGWVMDFDGIEDAFRRGGRLLVLCNPHNPLGRVYDRDELADLAEIVERHGGVVVSDEVHAPLVYGAGRHIPYASVSLAAAEHSITTISASKGWNIPGLKCAQAVFTSRRLRELWNPSAVLVSHGTSTLGMIANIAAYTAGVAWLDDAVDYLDGNRAELRSAVRQHLPAAVFHEPEATYLAWLDLELPARPEAGLGTLLLDAGVAVVDGRECGVGFENSIRFNFAMPRQLITPAIERIGLALSTL